MKGHGTKIIKLVSTSGKNTNDNSTEGKIGRVCYVDDSRTSAYVTKKILKEYGYEVDFFPSAEPAVVAILENDYDILLTDLTLSTGGMDGDELVRFLRNSGHPKKKLLPVIVITGTSDKDTLLKIYEAGANGVLVKPITGEELHDRIRTLVPEKAYPGTADGYALEIPQAMDLPADDSSNVNDSFNANDSDNRTTDSVLSSFDLSNESPEQTETTVSKMPSIPSAPASTPAKGTSNDLGVDQKVKAKKGKQTKPQAASQTTTKSNSRDDVSSHQQDEHQTDKKLSILENLKLAAFGNDDLDFDDDFADFDNTSGFDENINESKQHTTPAYKAKKADENLIEKPVAPKKKQKHKSKGAEFIAELRAQAKIDAEKIAQSSIEKAASTESVQNDSDDIPVLEMEPGNEDKQDLLFSQDTFFEDTTTNQDQTPHIDESNSKPELVTADNHDLLFSQDTFTDKEEKFTTPEIHDDIQLDSNHGDKQEPTIDESTPELKLENAEIKFETTEQHTQEKPAEEKSKEPKPEAAAELIFDAEELAGDKKIITALDINTDFSEFDDEIFEPSVAQSMFDVFRNYRLLGIATLVSVGIIAMSLINYFNLGDTAAVETVKVVKGTLHQTINVPGKVVSKLQINVSSSSAGQIVSVLVKEGQRVKKGEALVKLENEEAISDLKRAEGNLLSAKEETALANKTLKRMRRALKLGAISRQQMEEAEASLKSAQAKENVVLETRRTARLSLNKLNVSAAFDGTVTSRFAQIGQWITPSDTLFTLVDLSQLEMMVKVDSADSNSISIGQSVFVSSDAYADQSWTETVRRVAPATNNGDGTNTVSVFVSLGKSSPTLRLGQQIDAEIRTFSRKNTLKLPINAVVTRNGKSWIGTIEDGHVHYIPVDTGMEDLTHVEILKGSKAGQEIVISTGKELQEGDRIRIISTSAEE